MGYPTSAVACPHCEADITKQGSVSLVFEEYVEGFVNEDGADYEDSATRTPGRPRPHHLQQLPQLRLDSRIGGWPEWLVIATEDRDDIVTNEPIQTAGQASKN